MANFKEFAIVNCGFKKRKKYKNKLADAYCEFNTVKNKKNIIKQNL